MSWPQWPQPPALPPQTGLATSVPPMPITTSNAVASTAQTSTYNTGIQPPAQYTAAQYAALTPDQQFAIQQNWQQWQTYHQQYAQWHAQYGEQYQREMQAKMGSVAPGLPYIPPMPPYVQPSPTFNMPPPLPVQPTSGQQISNMAAAACQPPPPPPPPEDSVKESIQSTPPQPGTTSHYPGFLSHNNGLSQYGGSAGQKSEVPPQPSGPPPLPLQSVPPQPPGSASNVGLSHYPSQPQYSGSQQYPNAQFSAPPPMPTSYNSTSQQKAPQQLQQRNYPPPLMQIDPHSVAPPDSYRQNVQNQNSRRDQQSQNWRQSEGRNFRDNRNDRRSLGGNNRSDNRNFQDRERFDDCQEKGDWKSIESRNLRTDESPQVLKTFNSYANEDDSEKTPEERAFDEQFRKWEEEFENWKKQNANHPDRKAYSEYEMKFEDCRRKLLERREIMRKRKLERKLREEQEKDKPQQPVPDINDCPDRPERISRPDQQAQNKDENNETSKNQEQPREDTVAEQMDTSKEEKSENMTVNDEKETVKEEEKIEFLKTTSQSDGIPGLDLLPGIDKPAEDNRNAEEEADVIDLEEENRQAFDQEDDNDKKDNEGRISYISSNKSEIPSLLSQVIEKPSFSPDGKDLSFGDFLRKETINKLDENPFHSQDRTEMPLHDEPPKPDDFKKSGNIINPFDGLPTDNSKLKTDAEPVREEKGISPGKHSENSQNSNLLAENLFRNIGQENNSENNLASNTGGVNELAQALADPNVLALLSAALTTAGGNVSGIAELGALLNQGNQIQNNQVNQPRVSPWIAGQAPFSGQNQVQNTRFNQGNNFDGNRNFAGSNIWQDNRGGLGNSPWGNRNADINDNRRNSSAWRDNPWQSNSKFGDQRNSNFDDQRFGDSRSNFDDQRNSRFGDNRNSSFDDQRSSRFGDHRNNYDDQRNSRFGERNSRFGDQRNSNFGDQRSSNFRDQRNSSFGDQRNSNFGDQRNSSFGDQRNPNFGDQRNSNFGDQRNSNLGDQRNSNFGDQRNTSFGDKRNSDFGDQRNSNFGDQRNSNLGDQRNTSFGDQRNSNLGDQRNSDFGDQRNSNFGDQRNSNLGDQRNTSFGDQRNSNLGDQRNTNFGDQRNSNLGDQRNSNFGDQRNTNLGDQKNSNFGDQNNVNVDKNANIGVQRKSRFDNPDTGLGENEKDIKSGDEPNSNLDNTKEDENDGEDNVGEQPKPIQQDDVDMRDNVFERVGDIRSSCGSQKDDRSRSIEKFPERERPNPFKDSDDRSRINPFRDNDDRGKRGTSRTDDRRSGSRNRNSRDRSRSSSRHDEASNVEQTRRNPFRAEANIFDKKLDTVGPQDNYFRPAHVIDYQNKPLGGESFGGNTDMVCPTKIVDYGHMPSNQPSKSDDDYFPMKTIDYGHSSANTVSDYDQRANAQSFKFQNQRRNQKRRNKKSGLESNPSYPYEAWSLINPESRIRSGLPSKRGKRKKRQVIDELTNKQVGENFLSDDKLTTHATDNCEDISDDNQEFDEPQSTAIPECQGEPNDIDDVSPPIFSDALSNIFPHVFPINNLSSLNKSENILKEKFSTNIEHNTKNTISIKNILCKPGRCSRPKKICIILRGPPGSGKSYFAKLIKDKEVEMGGSAPRILSIDDYFMTEVDKEEKCLKTGIKITKKEMVYEYEKEMEDSYMQYLLKAFKKTINDRLFDFIIIDCHNHSLKLFNEFYNVARENQFTPYTIDLLCDIKICLEQNIHNRSEYDIRQMINTWTYTPEEYVKLDVKDLIEESNIIREVEMEDVSDMEEEPNKSQESNQDSNETDFIKSKWDTDPLEEKLARLDGTNKVLQKAKNITLEEYLQMDGWEPPVSTSSNKKRVRWADIEEKREQDKMRAIGFVVGQTDWNRMMDPTGGSSALTKTKYIARVKKN